MYKRQVVGGCAFNAANVLRQLGAPYELFAPVGCGIFAGFVERELRERGLEAQMCIRDRSPVARSTALLAVIFL